MKTIRFSIKSIINQPIEIVVKAYINPDNILFWTTGLEKLEIIKDGPNVVGSIAHLHFVQKGKKYML
jgi:hypothetical protein